MKKTHGEAKIGLQSRAHKTGFIVVLIFIFYYFLNTLFLEREEGKEKGRETSVCGCLSCAPYWGPGRQPRHVP